VSSPQPGNTGRLRVSHPCAAVDIARDIRIPAPERVSAAAAASTGQERSSYTASTAAASAVASAPAHRAPKRAA
jgi:hypothetical protein